MLMTNNKIDIEKIREDFPILKGKQEEAKQIVYFDNAATSHKPNAVLEAEKEYYHHQNSNIHRGVHYLSQKATDAFENSRKSVAEFINAERNHEVIFTSGTTDSINLVASSFGDEFIKKGDEVLISEMEHHSNIVPWQMICEKKGAELKVIPINDKGEIILDEYKNLLSDKTSIVALSHVSNTLGTINPVQEMTEIAHQKGIPVLLDGAQAVPH
ncbi:MAG: aminotransferase class V-fold PLP-dependent enzyme, partial [Flavobacteriales bacterium]